MSLNSDLKPTTKSERRALQEAQRAAKAAVKGLNGVYMTLVFDFPHNICRNF